MSESSQIKEKLHQIIVSVLSIELFLPAFICSCVLFPEELTSLTLKWLCFIDTKERIQYKLENLKYFSDLEKDRIVEMAWEDRTTFDIIKLQFGISQGEVEKLMRTTLKPSSFRRWRKRVSSGIGVKHAFKANPDMQRFKCSRQRSISMNKIAKR